MEIFDLFCFLSLVKHCHFYEAAEELYISQSALSRNIQSLENELNVKLFLRKTNGSVLTEAGQAFLPFAQNIIAEYDRMNSKILSFKDSMKDTLTVYTFSHLVAYNVQYMLDAFEKANPDICLKVLELETNTSHRMIMQNNQSVAIAFSQCRNLDNICSTDLFSDNFTAIVSKNSSLAKYNELSMMDLKNHRVLIVSREHEGFLHEYLSDQCKRFGITPDNKRELWYTTLGNATTRYDLVSLMPTHIAELITDNDLKKVTLTDIDRISVSIDAYINEDGTVFEPASKLITFASDYFHI